MAEYSMQWGAGHPGCVIFLLDWSGSMSEEFAAGRVGAGQTKCDTLANVLNSAIVELKDKCVKGAAISHRADVAVIGYGETVENVLARIPGLSGLSLVPIPTLAENPLKVETRVDKEVTQTGKILEYPVQFPIWVEPVARGRTPMCGAIETAFQLASSWADQHKHCFPPVVINITDGESTDGDPSDSARRLQQVRTNDGALLLFNCHLSALDATKVVYPGSESELPAGDKNAPVLFRISSEIPEPMRQLAAKDNIKPGIKEGDRGFVLNGDVESVIKMIQMGTMPGLSGGSGEDMPTR